MPVHILLLIQYIQFGLECFLTYHEDLNGKFETLFGIFVLQDFKVFKRAV